MTKAKRKLLRVAGIGHRPRNLPCLYGDLENKWADSIKKDLQNWLEENKPDLIITSLSPGWDMWLAECALHLGMRVDAYLAFRDQSKSWIGSSKRRFDSIIVHKNVVPVIIQEEWTPDCYYKRDKALVDDSSILLTLWDGKGKNDVFHALEYAKEKKRQTINFWNYNVTNKNDD